jgi:hypothetical protein
LKKRPSRRAKLAAVARENDRAIRELIRHRLSLPMSQRMNFLRVRIAPGKTAL